MAKWLKRAGWALGALLVLAIAVIVLGLQLADRRMQRKVDVQARPVAYRTDAPVLARGRYLFESRGCADCHGSRGEGKLFLDNGDLKVRAPHISPGGGSVTVSYKPEDWERTIRHGVAPGGRPLIVMPSEDYNRLTDDDLSALVSYLRSMPPTDGGAAMIEFPKPVRVLYGLGMIQDAAAKIDHSLAPAQPVAEAVSVEHGKYVANMCMGCHGPQLAGGPVPGGPPDWPPAARLAPGEGTVMTRYATAEAMQAMFKSGTRPDGSTIQVMPFSSLKVMSDTDVKALHLYLTSLK